jgi:hypothetical protein
MIARLAIAAVAAALLPASLGAQTSAQPAIADQSYAVPVGGTWTYAKTADGSEATFVGASGLPQLVLQCNRAVRQVTIAKPSAAAPYLQVWTSSITRNLPAAFTAATGRLSASLASWDRLLDAMAMSRGRIAVSASGQPALVLPPWAEIGRVVEDCRV